MVLKGLNGGYLLRAFYNYFVIVCKDGIAFIPRTYINTKYIGQIKENVGTEIVVFF